MAAPALVIFDLDRTLTRHDSYLAYLFGFLLRHPWRIIRLLPLPWSILLYYARRIDNTALKQRFLRAVLGGVHRTQLDRWTQRFVDRLLAHGLREQGLQALERHRQRGDVLVLLTASFDFYVQEVGRRLGFDHVICTEAEWQGDRLSGNLACPNRYGAEKVRCIRILQERFKAVPIIAYADDHSDLPLLRLADRGILVNGSTAVRKAAAQLGIQCCEWKA